MKTISVLAATLLLSACAQPPSSAMARSEAAARTRTAPPQQSRVIADSSAIPPPQSQPGVTPPPPVTYPPATAGPLADRPDVQAFIAEMAGKHGFSRSDLQALFSRAYSQPEIIALISRPAEAKPWYAYRSIFLTPQRIKGGVDFWRAHEAALAEAERTYGVPSEIIVAIIGVETAYGGNTGKFRVLEALSTLAFDYPKRADYFRKELENYLLLTRDEGIDPLSLKGSYAGAMGFGQFMPSSYRVYAVDFDGDRHRDLWRNPRDAIGSVANYLSKHRWQAGQPVTMPAGVNGDEFRSLLSKKPVKPSLSVAGLRQYGVLPQGAINDQQAAALLELDGDSGPEYWLGFDNFYVITRYNQSALYAMAVYQLSQQIRGLRESQRIILSSSER